MWLNRKVLTDVDGMGTFLKIQYLGKWGFEPWMSILETPVELQDSWQNGHIDIAVIFEGVNC